ncbi:MAG: energy-coupling factor ABC transporter substrate-binding protein [Nitrospirae bacterium]|nr:energy-coupling factor ABC transporter substrate-binding protein [Nitrospirota bacterium]
MLCKNVILLFLCITIAVTPLLIHTKASFTGTDDQAVDAVKEIKADYVPWMRPLWTPPSSEVASLIFALQAAAGMGFIGYYIGYKRAMRQKTFKDSTSEHANKHD